MRFIIVILTLVMANTAFCYEFQSTHSNLKLFQAKKVGFGFQSGAESAALGFRLALNIEDQDGASAGFGYGSGFQTFTMAWRHHFEGEYFTPYTHLGWSRWHNSSRSEKISSYILNAQLNSDEQRTGRFGLDFILASAGMQYQELSGDLQGLTFNLEAGILHSLRDGQLFPTASFGAGYYF